VQHHFAQHAFLVFNLHSVTLYWMGRKNAL